MEKSVFTTEHKVFTDTLRRQRKRARLTQVELAERLGVNQVFVSRFERGETRLDIVQLRTICEAIGLTLPKFVEKFELALRRKAKE